MAQFSPELIKQTISIFESRTGRKISKEDAREALENISGFFQLLQDWAKAEGQERCENRPSSPARIEGGK